MSRSFFVDSLINSPQNSEPSSPSSLPPSPGSPFPYPPLGGYLFSFGIHPPGFPKPTQPALSMLYPHYPLYGLDTKDTTKVIRPLPLSSPRKQHYSPHKVKPTLQKVHRPTDLAPSSFVPSIQGKQYK